MSQARPLSSEDVRGLREELAAGTTPTVWFTDSAVGVEPGRSGKVTALGEPAEGDFIQVRPAGSKDVLSFSAGEVTVVKPPRKRKETAAEPTSASSGNKSGRPSSAASRGAGGSRTVDASTGETATKQQRSPAASTGATTQRSAKETTGTAGSAKETAGSTKDTGASGRSGRPGGAQRSKQGSPTGATITMTAGPEGRWSVEVNNGKKRVLRSTPVPASAVAHAAKALHEDVAEAVEPLLEAAREQQRTRVEQLQRELDEAQQALNNLNG